MPALLLAKGGSHSLSEAPYGERQNSPLHQSDSVPHRVIGPGERLVERAILWRTRLSFPQPRSSSSGRALHQRGDHYDAKHHQGHNFGFILGGIMGVIFLTSVAIVVYVRWKQRPTRQPGSQSPYGRVVLEGPSQYQEDPLLIRESWKPDPASAPVGSFTISPLWRNRLDLHPRDGAGVPSSLLFQHTLPKDGPTLVFLPPPNTRRQLYFQDNGPIHATSSDRVASTSGTNHQYPPFSDVHYDAVPRHSTEAGSLDISAADSDSLQVNISWRDSARFTQDRKQLTEDPESMPSGEVRAESPVAQSESTSDGLSSLHIRALDSEREEVTQRASKTTSNTHSEKRDSTDSEGVSEGSETASSLSSFARLKLRWTGSTPFLPLIEETSPLDTDSLWNRFRRSSAQSIPNSLKSRSARKSSVPKTSSPLTPGSAKSSNISHPSPVTRSPKPEISMNSLTGSSINVDDPSDRPRQPQSSVNFSMASSAQNIDAYAGEHQSQTVFDSSVGLSPPSGGNMQLSLLSVNTGDLPPTLYHNPDSVEGLSQDLSTPWKLTPDMPHLSMLPSRSPAAQSSVDSSLVYDEGGRSPSPLSLSDFPDVPSRRPYRPLPIRPLPRIPQPPVIPPPVPPVSTVQPRLPPVPRSQPPRPPVNVSLPRMRRFMPYPDRHRRIVTTPYAHSDDPITSHKLTQSS